MGPSSLGRGAEEVPPGSARSAIVVALALATVGIGDAEPVVYWGGVAVNKIQRAEAARRLYV